MSSRSFVLVSVLACATAGDERTNIRIDSISKTVSLACEDLSSPLLTDSSVGPLRVRTSLQSARRLCPIIADTVVQGPEAVEHRRVTFAVAGDTAFAIVENDSLWRLEVSAPFFRTGDGLGVGSTLGELLRPGVTGLEDEGVLFVLLPEHCGLSFQLSYEPGDTEHRERWHQADLRGLAVDARVVRVLIVGCEPR